MLESFSYIDNRFSENESNTYGISIRQFEDGYTFYVYNSKNETLAAEFRATKADESRLVALNYKDVRYIGGGIATLLNNTLLENSKEAEILMQSRALLQLTQTHKDALTDNISLIARSNHWKSIITADSYEHELTAIYNHAIKIGYNCVYINILPHRFALEVVDNATPLLARSFAYSTTNDVIYYVLAAYQQCRINPQATPLCISGFQSNEYATELAKYIKTIIIDKPQNWAKSFPSDLAPIFAINS